MQAIVLNVFLWVAIPVLVTLYKSYTIVKTIFDYSSDDPDDEPVKVTFTVGTRKTLAKTLVLQFLFTVTLIILALYHIWIVVGEYL